MSFVDYTDTSFQARVIGFNRISLAGDSVIVVANAFNWDSGINYSFDLTGRSAQAGTAFLTKESGTLGINENSIFDIVLASSNLTGSSGSFLLLDGLNDLVLNFGINSVNLIFNGTSETGKFNGSSLVIADTTFNLVYDQTMGKLSLNWATSPEQYREEPMGKPFNGTLA